MNGGDSNFQIFTELSVPPQAAGSVGEHFIVVFF